MSEIGKNTYMYSETCRSDHLSKATTCKIRPLFTVPPIIYVLFSTCQKRPPAKCDQFDRSRGWSHFTGFTVHYSSPQTLVSSSLFHFERKLINFRQECKCSLVDRTVAIATVTSMPCANMVSQAKFSLVFAVKSCLHGNHIQLLWVRLYLAHLLLLPNQHRLSNGEKWVQTLVRYRISNAV